MAWASNSRRRAELPKDWKRIRERVLRRDGFKCVFCGAPANQVDHIDPRGPHSLGNLRSLCRTCHMRRTAGQAHNSRRKDGWTPSKKRTLREPTKHPGLL